MKIVIEKSNALQTEVIIRCANTESEEVNKIKQLLETIDQKVMVTKDCLQTFLQTTTIIYCEYVNRKVFVYTYDDMFTTKLSLTELEALNTSLFRCSKNTIINVNEITTLRSEINGNILATLSSGEKALISRHYASKLRKFIKER